MYVKLDPRRSEPEIQTILDIVSPSGAHIAGGYVRWMASPLSEPDPPGDIDIFSPNAEAISELVKAFENAGWRLERTSDFAYTYEAPGDLEYPTGGGETALQVQLIRDAQPRMTSPTLEGVLDGFDFTVIAAGLTPTGTIIAHPNLLHHEAHRLLIWHHMHTPVMAFQRVLKYSSRGYWMPPSETIKLLNDWASKSAEARDAITDRVNNSYYSKEDFWENERTFEVLTLSSEGDDDIPF